jgi:hypothetical protein
VANECLERSSVALIEGFRVQNYRSLRDVALGRLSGNPDAGAF